MLRFLFSLILFAILLGLCLCLVLGLASAITLGGISEAHHSVGLGSILIPIELFLCLFAGFGFASLQGIGRNLKLLPAACIAACFGLLISMTNTLIVGTEYRLLRPFLYALFVFIGEMTEHFLLKYRKL